MTNKQVSVLHLHISHPSPCLFNNKNIYLSLSPFQPSENSYQAAVLKCTEKFFFSHVPAQQQHHNLQG